MKKILFLLLSSIIAIDFTFASYVLPVSIVKKTENIANNIISYVETKYPTKYKTILWEIANSIDLYIALHRNQLNDTKMAVLLLLKTLILEHMGYKVGNPVELKIVSEKF